MLNLPTPSAVVQVVTGAGVNAIEVHASFDDLSIPTSALVNPGAKNTSITTATTTTVVPAPAAGLCRNVKYVSIVNSSGAPCAITVQLFDGTSTFPIFGSVNLLAGWMIEYTTDGSGFVVIDNTGKIQVESSGGGVAISAGAASVSSGTVVFSNSNGVSFGLVGSTVTASVLAAGAGLNISAGTTSSNVTAVTFSNANNVSFGFDGSNVTASASLASSQGAINISAGTTSNLSSAFTFANSNGVSFGLNAGTITASVPPSISALNLSAGTTSQNLSAVTFSNSNGISFGLNGSVVTASVAPGAGTISAFSQDADFVTQFPVGQGVLSLQKLSLPMNLLATELAVIADFQGASGASGAVTLSHAVYTLSGGTASLASSGSRALSWTLGSATSASSLFGGASGTRYRTMGVSYAMTPGDYLFGWWVSASGAATVSAFGRAAMNIVGTYDGVETAYFLPGVSASSLAAFPGSIAASDTGYVRTGFSAMRQVGAILLGTH